MTDRIVRQTDMYRECSDTELYELIDMAVLGQSRQEYLSLSQKLKLKKDIFNSLRRFDILQDYLDDESVTEIMVNGPENIFIERDGRLERCEETFEPPERLADIVQQIASGANRIVNESSPIVDARLPDASRVNIVLPPVSLSGPIVTIRKFPSEVMTMEKLVELGALTEEAADYLKPLVVSGYNIFISGGTGSGKTTFLNALSGYIPRDERIITIEDSAELQIKQIPNIVRLESRNANSCGENEITIRALIKSALRMRPNRLVVGEVRDGACIDMLQALNTGHCGMSTGHANSPEDCLSRLETMVLLGADIPLMAARQQIASAIDIIIHLGRMRDRSRKVMKICEVEGISDGEIMLNTIMEFEEDPGESVGGKVRGRLRYKGAELKHTAKLRAAGLFEEFCGLEQELLRA